MCDVCVKHTNLEKREAGPAENVRRIGICPHLLLVGVFIKAFKIVHYLNDRNIHVYYKRVHFLSELKSKIFVNSLF